MEKNRGKKKKGKEIKEKKSKSKLKNMCRLVYGTSREASTKTFIDEASRRSRHWGIIRDQSYFKYTNRNCMDLRMVCICTYIQLLWSIQRKITIKRERCMYACIVYVCEWSVKFSLCMDCEKLIRTVLHNACNKYAWTI